ncbi:MAG: hypothetical protein IKU37_07435 [Candidatus Gastranaerophilales bacterium]|nr:hypothetical protein [Candidatus Gastranaerophilales bacterium]
MKKIFCLLVLLLFFQGLSFAVTIGTYKTETEYGLLDGFKWNFFNKEGKPLVQLKSETEEEKIRIEREKNKPKEVQDDVRLYRFMLDDTVAF